MGHTKELTLIKQGKVANVYTAGTPLVLERTGRLSALNSKVEGELKYKPEVLNQLSKWWMLGPLAKVCDNHLLNLPEDIIPFGMRNRASIVRNLEPILVECVVRRHITGSAFTSYKSTGQICGIQLPVNLHNGDRLEEYIFTPTDKSDTDDAISFQEMQEKIGVELANKLRKLSLEIFEIGEQHLLEKGIILVDAKFEFGIDGDGNVYLMDEVLTPDSSRFWVKQDWERDGTQKSFDKQKLRDWLLAQKQSGAWDGESSISVPENLLEEMSQDYVYIFERITGESPRL